MPAFLPPLLMIFVKYPEPGRVKTRLAREVGAEEAAAIYQRMVAEVIAQLPKGQRVRVLYDDFRPEAEYRRWLAELPEAEFVAQADGDLGVRLETAFAQAFADGWKRVGVIGSDCVELDEALYCEAWARLEENEPVIGPAYDGGYYFLGLQEPRPALFAGVNWSSETVLQETLQAAEALGLDPFLLPKRHDVDTLADWERAGEKVRRPAPPGIV